MTHPVTDEFIVKMITMLLHLAYKGKLKETDALLFEAEQRFVKELYEEEQGEA